MFDEKQHRFTPLSLFPEDRPVPADAIDSVPVKLSQMKLERARPYGNCWLGCELWRQLQLDRFWAEKLPEGRASVAWAQVLELLVVNRLIDPGSQFRVHRQWFDPSALDVWLGQDFAVAEKDRLYRCPDRVLNHKQELFVHLQQRWKDLFEAEFDLLLYDLTSTYVEGAAEQNPKQVVIALVLTPTGLPLAYEVMAGNTSDNPRTRRHCGVFRTRSKICTARRGGYGGWIEVSRPRLFWRTCGPRGKTRFTWWERRGPRSSSRRRSVWSCPGRKRASRWQ